MPVNPALDVAPRDPGWRADGSIAEAHPPGVLTGLRVPARIRPGRPPPEGVVGPALALLEPRP